MDNRVVALQQTSDVLSILDSVDISQVKGTLNKIAQFQAVVQQTLKKDHDYGVIGGTQKPTLLKPGAEKILMLMGITSEYEMVERIEDYDKGVFAFTVKCILLKNGLKITEGFGSCNSKEDKYRWRWVKEEDIPYGIDKETLKSKTNNYGKVQYRIENDEICSQANTILKMAKKRAQIDATLTVAALSEIFTQDLEDMKEFIQNEEIDNMKSDEVTNIKVNFGKHKGKTLGQINKEAPDYIEWLAKNGNDAAMRKACEMIMQESLKQKDSKQGNKQDGKQNTKPTNKQNSQPVEEDYTGTPFEDGLVPPPEDSGMPM